MKYVAITSFNEKGYLNYGKQFIESFLKYWPINLIIYYEGLKPDINNPRVQFKDLLEVTDATTFASKSNKIKNSNGVIKGQYNYSYDAIKFSKKAYAIADSIDADIKIWLDADVLTFAEITKDTLAELCPTDEIFSYLGREGYMHTESGFLAFNQNHPLHKDFLKQYIDLYNSLGIYHLAGWTDCHAFDLIRTLFQHKGAKTLNLSNKANGDLDVFSQSPLKGYMKHFKGTAAKSQLNANINRYSQLIDLIRQYQPESIIEIGTWNGARAIQMATEAFKYKDEITYMGYDLFEDASDETDSRELNVKKHNSIDSVHATLDKFSNKYPGFSFGLTKGDTRKTLKPSKFDFAFIDGGHSIETIESDFNNLKECDVVVFDDYYTPDADGKCPDLEKYGCNRIVEKLNHKVLPIADPIAGGGLTHFVVVTK